VKILKTKMEKRNLENPTEYNTQGTITTLTDLGNLTNEVTEKRQIDGLYTSKQGLGVPIVIPQEGKQITTAI
jgi:hypothetical protein